MKKLYFIIISLAPFVAHASSIDPVNISQGNRELFKNIDEKCEHRSFAETTKCTKKFSAQYELEGKIRGTTRYAATHYKKLSNEALKELATLLITMRTNARDLGDAMMDRVEGELSKDKYEAEIDWIIGELKSRGVSPPRSYK
ncbi:MAG: hypothetical protein ACNA7Y_03220 [Gammaproteobacteria bacterium]